MHPITRSRPSLRLLSEEQKTEYERQGFLALPGHVGQDWLERLHAVTADFVEQSREADDSDRRFDLEPSHGPEQPRIRRLNSPADLHPVYWEFASDPVLVDLVDDLIGPDLKFHHGKLNFKAPRGGEEVKWHQDIQFWPHTNYTPLTVGVFLADVEPGMGNVGFVPQSHEGPLYDQYDGDDWIGCLSREDAKRAGVENAIYPIGPAGTVTIHNCRTVHGSAPNLSDRERPLLLQTYAAADAFTYTRLVDATRYGDQLIRGNPARWAVHDPRPCQVGPTRPRTIFEVQQRSR